MCVLIAVKNWLTGITGNWYLVLYSDNWDFNLVQAVQYFGHYFSAIRQHTRHVSCLFEHI